MLCIMKIKGFSSLCKCVCNTQLGQIHNSLRTIYLSKRNLNQEYASSVSLKTLYPDSEQKIITPSNTATCESGSNFSGFIPVDKLKITYSRSSGPGGQHVNKVNTKVEIRFNIQSAEWLTEDVKQRLFELKKNSITKEGELIIRSDRTRSAHLNLADVLQRLRTIIYQIADVKSSTPTPETLERIRKGKEAANRERLRMKKMRSLTKQNRGKVDD